MSVGLTSVIMETDSYIAWIGGYMRKSGRSRSTAGESCTGTVPVPPENLPLEDMILKSAVTYFGEVLLPYLGIDCKITGIAPTELVYLEVKGLIEDFTYIVSDGSWIHLEFESDKVTEKDLRRFRGYEAVTGYTYQVPVTTNCDLLSKDGGGTERAGRRNQYIPCYDGEAKRPGCRPAVRSVEAKAANWGKD